MIAEGFLAASLLAGANYADFATTRGALSRGGMEVNGLIGQQGQRLVGVKLAAASGEFLVFKALQKKHKKTAWLWVGTIVAYNLTIARHNSQVLR